MEDVFECLKRELEEGRHAVLLTVIASTGSTPRSAGSHQLVLADGTTVGTIGGGIAEYKATGSCSFGPVDVMIKTGHSPEQIEFELRKAKMVQKYNEKSMKK